MGAHSSAVRLAGPEKVPITDGEGTHTPSSGICESNLRVEPERLWKTPRDKGKPRWAPRTCLENLSEGLGTPVRAARQGVRC